MSPTELPGDPTSPTCLSPPPIHEYLPDYLPAYLSNGLIGARIGQIPLTDGVCVVNGLVERDPVEDGEGFARAPYPFAGDLQVDGHWLTSHSGQARFLEQAYDFGCGELHTAFEFRPDATRLRVQVVSFCSRSLPALVLQEVRLEVDDECELSVRAGLNQVGIPGRWKARRTHTPGSAEPVVDGLMEWETDGSLSSCGAAYVTSLEGADGFERRVDDIDRRAPLQTSYRFRALPGRRYVVRQIAGLLSSNMHSEPDRQAARMVYVGATRGFERLRDENRAAWREIWRGRVRLVGADTRWQRIADASFYYLHASTHASSVFSTAMFGLAYWPNYHYYHGHVMWDIEAFTLPVCLLTAPDVARAMLGYRLERLGAARRNAAMNGRAGLQFPWAGSPVHGEEVIRLSKPQVIFEQHVNMSVARAFAHFCHATGDDAFLRDDAWRVLSGVASWIESRVVETERGFEIREALGIAEQQGPVDNDAYVNMAAAVVLREAAAAASRLSEPGADRWEDLAARIYVPIDPDSGVILNHDDYVYRENDPVAATPEALAGLFPMDYHAEPEVEKATLRFYLDRIEPFLGRPMLSALLGAWGARLGDRRLSAHLFEVGYAEFIEDPFWVAKEFSPRVRGQVRAGPLMAHVGGFLSSCLYGLTRLQLGPGEPDTWPQAPTVMPESWDAVEVDRVWVRGRAARLVGRHGQLTRIEPH
jgi:trehalose/maltose hydrolase-like predicted phosphorylase